MNRRDIRYYFSRIAVGVSIGLILIIARLIAY